MGVSPTRNRFWAHGGETEIVFAMPAAEREKRGKRRD